MSDEKTKTTEGRKAQMVVVIDGKECQTQSERPTFQVGVDVAHEHRLARIDDNGWQDTTDGGYRTTEVVDRVVVVDRHPGNDPFLYEKGWVTDLLMKFEMSQVLPKHIRGDEEDRVNCYPRATVMFPLDQADAIIEALKKAKKEAIAHNEKVVQDTANKRLRIKRNHAVVTELHKLWGLKIPAPEQLKKENYGSTPPSDEKLAKWQEQKNRQFEDSELNWPKNPDPQKKGNVTATCKTCGRTFKFTSADHYGAPWPGGELDRHDPTHQDIELTQDTSKVEKMKKRYKTWDMMAEEGDGKFEDYEFIAPTGTKLTLERHYYLPYGMDNRVLLWKYEKGYKGTIGDESGHEGGREIQDFRTAIVDNFADLKKRLAEGWSYHQNNSAVQPTTKKVKYNALFNWPRARYGQDATTDEIFVRKRTDEDANDDQ